MNFEKLCRSIKQLPLDPKEVVVQFLHHNSDVFYKILKEKDNEIYIKILNILLEKEEENLEEFVDWFRDYLYNY